MPGALLWLGPGPWEAAPRPSAGLLVRRRPSPPGPGSGTRHRESAGPPATRRSARPGSRRPRWRAGGSRGLHPALGRSPRGSATSHLGEGLGRRFGSRGRHGSRCPTIGRRRSRAVRWSSWARWGGRGWRPGPGPVWAPGRADPPVPGRPGRHWVGRCGRQGPGLAPGCRSAAPTSPIQPAVAALVRLLAVSPPLRRANAPRAGRRSPRVRRGQRLPPRRISADEGCGARRHGARPETSGEPGCCR